MLTITVFSLLQSIFQAHLFTHASTHLHTSTHPYFLLYSFSSFSHSFLSFTHPVSFRRGLVRQGLWLLEHGGQQQPHQAIFSLFLLLFFLFLFLFLLFALVVLFVATQAIPFGRLRCYVGEHLQVA